MNSSAMLIVVGLVLGLIQVAAAIPWLALLFWQDVKGVFGPRTREVTRSRTPVNLGTIVAVLLVSAAVIGSGIAAAIGYVRDAEWVTFFGRAYGSILHLQLTINVFILIFVALLRFWPKGGAVALSAFREAIRQLMFLILLGAGLLMIAASVVIPYFTFGEDFKMMQELGYDTIMLVAVLFCCLTASMSISEEIEGKTAITLISKPVSRRQFLLGKFVGLLLVAALITTLLGWHFDWMLYFKRGFEKLDPVAPPPILTTALQDWAIPREAQDCIKGIGLWALDAQETFPGLFLGWCQAMILLAAAVSLATRLPMVVNLTICGTLYFLGHLTPVLKQIAKSQFDALPTSPVNQMLLFMSQVFDALLPSLEFFNLGPLVVSERVPDTMPFLSYVGSVGLYGAMYTLILLLAGLVLFEDRDLA